MSSGSRRKPLQHRDRPQDGEQPVAILPFAERAADVDHVAAGLNSVDMGKVADVTANLRGQVRLEVFGASFLEQRIGMIFVGNGEFEAIDDFADARCLLGGPIHDHGLEGGRHLARQGDRAVRPIAP